MKTRITNILAALMIVGFSFYFSGCAVTAKIDSIKDVSYRKDLNRIFILVWMSQKHEKLSSALSESIRSAFISNGIAAEAVNVSALELDTSVYDDKIKAFSPDAVMTVFAKENFYTYDGNTRQIIFDASLYENNLNKRFWRANIIIGDGAAFITDNHADLISKSIIEKLKEDGLIKRSRHNYSNDDSLAEIRHNFIEYDI